VDLEEAIKCLIELVGFAGRAKDVVALKIIRKNLIDTQKSEPNSAVKELPPIAECMQALGYWRELERDKLDAVGAQNMYAHIKSKLSE
jgi:hypothetical protein